MNRINPALVSFVESDVIPRYAAFDKAHREDHARAVIGRALDLAGHYPVDRALVYTAAACHDLGLAVDRKTHHLESGKIIREMPELRRWFSETEIETVAQAAEDHRASSDHAPRSIYGRIVAEADRLIEPEQIIRRTVQFGLSHYPELARPGHWLRTLEHLHEKYADGGYLKLWIPESPNAARLEELRAIIRDETTLRELFNRIYREEVLGPLVCERYRHDERYRSGHIRIIAPAPGTVILGLHTPEMKGLARSLARREDLSGILDDWAADPALSHDERIIWGLTLDYMKAPVEERVRRIRQLLPRMDNWAICDTFCCNAKWVRDDSVRPFILDCIAPGQPEFTRRTGILFLMCHFLDDAHLQRTFADLESMRLEAGEPYYVRMGVAWLLATALAKHPAETRRYVNIGNLPDDILRLYIRKARESRITRDVPAR
ncbi:MAG: HD domain-containing protein [Bacteroidales bacterium]|nr:HD domain-containing protein [Bacteroidales bacterium]